MADNKHICGHRHALDRADLPIFLTISALLRAVLVVLVTRIPLTVVLVVLHLPLVILLPEVVPRDAHLHRQLRRQVVSLVIDGQGAFSHVYVRPVIHQQYVHLFGLIVP